MLKIALVTNNNRCKANYLETLQLPTNYMEDFTKLGFTVINFEEAFHILQSAGIEVAKAATGAEIQLNNYSEIEAIQQLFSSHNLISDFSDIADTMYQA